MGRYFSQGELHRKDKIPMKQIKIQKSRILCKICLYMFFICNKATTTSYGAIHRERTQGHRVPSINGTYNIFNYFVILAKQMDNLQTKKTNETKGKKDEETNDKNKQTNNKNLQNEN